GTEFVLPQNNGTSTLLAGYFGAGVGPGDEVITPTYNWLCSFGPAMLLGARPVFCDIDPETLCLDPADLPNRLTERTKAICVPHLFGAVCDMDPILEFAREHDLKVIEDCSHSHGAKYDGRLIGSLGDVGCFSMQGSAPAGKPVAAGEGGVLATNDRHIYERILAMGHLNRHNIAEELTHPPLNRLTRAGWAMVKFRVTNISLCIATVALDSLEYRNRRIQENYTRLLELIADVECLRPIKEYPKAENRGYYGHMRIIYVPGACDGLPAERFQEAVRAEGAPLAGRNYDSYHMTPPFDTGMAFYDDGRGPISPSQGYVPQPPGSLPNAEAVIPNILSLPTMIDPPEGYVEAFAEAIRKVYRHYGDLL
ncbi:MAG: DegT/DnrJ/EryC1/StrS family aminotransferase, partial [Armatimonadota bacterium]